MCDFCYNVYAWTKKALWGTSVTEHIAFLTFVGVVIGGIFALMQWRKNIKLKRADYIKELTETIRENKDISDVIYMLDYDESWYCEEFHQCGKLERKVDKTLAYFSYILYLRNEKILSKKEFLFFKYDIERILRNEQMQDYFYNLYHFSKTQDALFSFSTLLDYAKDNKLLDGDFEDREAHLKNRRYHRYLNF